MEGSYRMKYFALLLAIVAPVLAQEIKVQLDTQATQIHYTVDSTLHTVHGTFKLKHGDLWFDRFSGRAGGALIVDAASGDSGSGARDGRMHKNVLESLKFPEITFAPDRIEGGVVNLAGDSAVRLHGTLSIHGATHELVMNVKSHIDRDRLTATIDFPVPYVSWGMKNPGNFLLKVNNTVEIEIQAAGQLVGMTSKL
jgi:polyisoprenoid-binding protein YceI